MDAIEFVCDSCGHKKPIEERGTVYDGTDTWFLCTECRNQKWLDSRDNHGNDAGTYNDEE